MTYFHLDQYERTASVISKQKQSYRKKNVEEKCTDMFQQ